MYILPLIIVIAIALAVTGSRNGIGSFVTLGIIGAAIYAVPAVIDVQQSLASMARSTHRYVSVPTDVEFVVFMAWLSLLAGLLISVIFLPRQKDGAAIQFDDERMRSIAIACAALGILGAIYLAYAQGTIFFFLEERAEQDAGIVATLWRWTAPLGLIAASLSRDKRMLALNAAMLVIIFLRGDRTLVAIVTAALIVAASYKDPKWWKRLRPAHFAAFLFSISAVFLGKSLYILTKTSVTGASRARLDIPLKDQLIFQFEPLGTFAHLEFVMRTGITIPFSQFMESVLGNLLLVPSAFGISTNLYNTVVTANLSSRLVSGVAGNFMAHGYAVGGASMAAFFYFMMPLMLRLCDAQFRKKTGTVKIFWCCVGAVIAFYIHRNGLDNLFSFVRQIFIVCVATAALAAAMRHLGLVSALAAPRRLLVAGGAVPMHEFNLSPTIPPRFRDREARRGVSRMGREFPRRQCARSPA